MDQLSFASLDYAAKKKRTKRDVFLAEMAAVVPWGVLEGRIEPHYPKIGPTYCLTEECYPRRWVESGPTGYRGLVSRLALPEGLWAARSAHNTQRRQQARAA